MAWIVFDLETSGFKGLPMFSKCHEIIQIAARSSDDKRFSTFVQPRHICSIPPQSSAIHNICDEDLEGAPDIKDAVKTMFEHFGLQRGDSIRLVAHNNTWFDCPQLRRVCEEELWPEIEFFDTLPWFRQHEEFKSNTLSAIYNTLYETEIENMHRADVDVDALHRIYKEHVLPQLDEKPVPPEPTDKSPTVELRFIGPVRAQTIKRRCGATTIGEFKRFLLSTKRPDTWLQYTLKVFDVTHRMVILGQLHRGELHRCNELVAKIRDDAYDNVDYYVTCRYGKTSPRDFSASLYAAGLANLIRIGKQ